MPRYCAVKLCKNRGGVLSKDNKRISFYPFPLRDEARLRKWVYNMKREQWTPSRHQYLCSDHFTEDSFDLRWGIRYLKHTAVPTIFPFIYEGESSPVKDELKKFHNKKGSKTKPKTCDVNDKHIRACPLAKKGSLILKEEEDGVTSAGGALTTATGDDLPQVPTELFLTDLDSEGPCSIEAEVPISDTEPPGDSSTFTKGSHCEHSEATEGPASETLSPELAVPVTSQDSLQEVINQAINGLPVSLHDRDDEGCTEDPERDPWSAEHSLLDEHSYSRHDTDKEQLWSKIASLHVKIMELEKREEVTVAKINSLENTIACLKKENVVCEEKQKALEDYLTSVFL